MKPLAAVAFLSLPVLTLPPAASEDSLPHGQTMAVRPSYPSVNVIGFTDLDFSATDEKGLSSNDGFSEGQFVLHFASALSPHFTFFGEVSLTARSGSATSAATTSFNADVERSILRYTQSDHLKISIGRYHTPISYWNVAFHHGQWLQTTVGRPEMVQFGGSFVPVHFVGVLAEGSIPSGGVHLDYNLGLGNGRSSIISRGGDAGDVNENRAVMGRLFVRPDRPRDLEAGAAVYLDKISLGTGDYRELISSAYVAWTRETPEVIGEYVTVRHRAIPGGPALTSHAYYGQVAYRLPTAKARWKPYARWEELRIAGGDRVFSELRSRKGVLVGTRFDATDLVALKAEYRRQRAPQGPNVNGGFFQVSFSF